MSKLSSSRTGVILVAALIVVAGIAYAIPVIPVTYEESYQVQVPYTWIDEKEETIGSVNDRTVEGGYYIYWNSYIPVGRDVEFSVSASDTVNLYVFTSSQYSNYRDTGSKTPNEKEIIDLSSGKLGYHVSASDTYYFCVYNPHDGFLGIGAKSVGIYSSSVVEYWQEEETEDRWETHTRDVTIRVTLLEYLSGNYIP